MPTWLIVLIAIVVIGVVATIILQLPAKNRLVDVAGKADSAKLIKKLDAGADPNGEGWFGLTPLAGAIQKNRIENVKILLDRGANPNRAEGKMGYLQQCVLDKREVILELLLQAGADPNLRGFNNDSALEDAIDAGLSKCVKLLLRYKGNAASSDADGNYLITVATALGVVEKNPNKRLEFVDIVAALIEYGANPNSRDLSGRAIIGLTLDTPKLLRVLVDGGAIIDVAWDGINLKPLIEAALANDPDAPTNLGNPTS